MDLMIDCMCNPSFDDVDDKLYEMLEDDMRTIANLSSLGMTSTSSSPAALSGDEEHLGVVLSNTAFDEFMLFSTTPSTQSSQASNNSNNSAVATSNHPSSNLPPSHCNGGSSATNSSNASSLYYQQSAPPVLTSFHPAGDVFNYSSSSGSSCSSSSSSSPSISAVPSPLSLSSSSSSLCTALANASFSSSSSSSASSTCSSNLASPVCLSPNTPGVPHHHTAQHTFTHLGHHVPPPQLSQHAYQQQQQQTSAPQHSYMLNESSINYHLNKQKNQLIFDEDLVSNSGGNNNGSYMLQDGSFPISTRGTPTMARNAGSSTAASPVNMTMSNSNSYSLFQTINPMDINRNYAAATNESSSANKSSRPTTVCLPSGHKTTATYLSASQSGAGQQQQQQQQPLNKRGKFSHTPSSSCVFRIKSHESGSGNSDGESVVSNESDSNSSTYSNGLSGEHNLHYQPPPHSKKLIITATKLDGPSFYSAQSAPGAQSVAANASNAHQINVIKIASSQQKDHADNLLLPITPAKISIEAAPVAASSASAATKTIIKYNQLVQPSVGGTAVNSSGIVTSPKQSLKHNRQNGGSGGLANAGSGLSNGATSPVQVTLRSDGKAYPKPPYSYSCLIAMALRNSDSGTLPVSDIYEFIVENFPYYKTARDGWKNSIRHNLSLNKCFEKIENPTNGSKKGCLWALNPDKCKKLEEECKRCRQRDPVNIRLSMSRPDDLIKIERGEQRIKKYTAQRKLHGAQAASAAAAATAAPLAITLATSSAVSTGDHASDASSTASSNTQSESGDEQASNFLLDWASKSGETSSLAVKDEPNDQYLDELGNSDIKFDPMLLSSVNSSI